MLWRLARTGQTRAAMHIQVDSGGSSGTLSITPCMRPELFLNFSVSTPWLDGFIHPQVGPGTYLLLLALKLLICRLKKILESTNSKGIFLLLLLHSSAVCVCACVCVCVFTHVLVHRVKHARARVMRILTAILLQLALRAAPSYEDFVAALTIKEGDHQKAAFSVGMQRDLSLYLPAMERQLAILDALYDAHGLESDEVV